MTTSTHSHHTTGQNRDLQERITAFAYDARSFVRKTPKTIASMGDCRRLVRASGEIGSAYIDADRAASKDQFAACMLDCCREARQAQHWLQLLDCNLDERGQKLQAALLQEARELEKIFGSIVQKMRTKKAAKTPVAA